MYSFNDVEEISITFPCEITSLKQILPGLVQLCFNDKFNKEHVYFLQYLSEEEALEDIERIQYQRYKQAV
jgi:hypothetical protein